MSDSDFADGGADGTTPPQTPPQNSGQDWEARFKGLQRSYNKLQGQYEALQGTVQTQTETIDGLKDARRSIAADLEAKQRELNEQLKTLTAERDTLASEKSELSETVALFEQTNAKRDFLNKNEEVRDLMPFLDNDMIDFDPSDEESALQKLNRFREMLGERAGANFDKEAKGGTPKGTDPDPQARQKKMSEDELSQWLLENPSHSDYAKYEDMYLAAVENRVN